MSITLYKVWYIKAKWSTSDLVIDSGVHMSTIIFVVTGLLFLRQSLNSLSFVMGGRSIVQNDVE